MNYKLLNLVIFLLLFLITCFIQGCETEKLSNGEDEVDLNTIIEGWEISKHQLNFDINPNPLDMYFVNAEIGYFVGYWGEIYKTTDAGNSWKKQNSGTGARLQSVFFIDENTGFTSSGWGGDDDGYTVFLQTVNGGETWTKAFICDYLAILCLHFFDNMNGLSIIRTSQTQSVLAKTSNGGASWEFIDLNIKLAFDKFYCVDNIIFIAGANQTIFKSNDQGNTWETIHTPLPAWNDVYSIYFYNKNIGYIDGGTDIYKTVDGGLSWEIVNFPFSNFRFNTFHFYNEMEGFNIEYVFQYVGGDFPTYMGCIGYQTYDGGTNWKESGLVKAYFGINYFVQSNLGYGIGPTEFFTIKRSATQ